MLIGLSYLIIPSNAIEDGPYKKLGGVLREPKNTIDYIALGDSECMASIIPMELWNKYGYTGFNCGVPGQRLQDTYYMLKEILKKQSPKVILLETNALYRNFSYTDVFQNAVDEAVKNILPVYKYHNSWKNFNFDLSKSFGSNYKNIASKQIKGYQYNPTVKPYLSGPYIKKTKQTIVIQEEPLLYTDKIVSLCKEHNIKLILYTVPSPLCWTYAKHNAAAAFAKEHKITYLDLNLRIQKLHLNWLKDTRDKGNHMNFFGAKKVTKYLGRYFSKHCDLIDHRGDNQYTDWQNALNEYKSITSDRSIHSSPDLMPQ